LNSANNRRVALVIVFLVGLIGAGNLVAGVWSLSTINSLNIPNRISALSSATDSLDPTPVETPELRDQISDLKTAIMEELNFLHDYSQQLNLIPAYLILQGIMFMATSSAMYFMIPKREKGPKAS
jgi:hypothetical protein